MTFLSSPDDQRNCKKTTKVIPKFTLGPGREGSAKFIDNGSVVLRREPGKALKLFYEVRLVIIVCRPLVSKEGR